VINRLCRKQMFGVSRISTSVNFAHLTKKSRVPASNLCYG
jgi:hypothetical protein